MYGDLQDCPIRGSSRIFGQVPAGGGAGQDEQEAVGVVGQPAAGGLPLPAIGLKVSKAAFLPSAKGVMLGLSGRVVGQQAPGVGIAFSPDHQHRHVQPTGFLEDLSDPAPVLSRRIDQVFEGALLSALP